MLICSSNAEYTMTGKRRATNQNWTRYFTFPVLGKDQIWLLMVNSPQLAGRTKQEMRNTNIYLDLGTPEGYHRRGCWKLIVETLSTKLYYFYQSFWNISYFPRISKITNYPEFLWPGNLEYYLNHLTNSAVMSERYRRIEVRTPMYSSTDEWQKFLLQSHSGSSRMAICIWHTARVVNAKSCLQRVSDSPPQFSEKAFPGQLSRAPQMMCTETLIKAMACFVWKMSEPLTSCVPSDSTTCQHSDRLCHGAAYGNLSHTLHAPDGKKPAYTRISQVGDFYWF